MSTRVLVGFDVIRRPPVRPVVTIGMFDGVHIAHQRLIGSALQLARRLDGTSVVITFDPDPQSVLGSTAAQLPLMPLDVRVECLRGLGVDWIWVIPFTKQFARLTAGQFVRQVLVGRLHAVALVVGEAFVFGRRRCGNARMLQTLSPSCGIRMVPVRSIRRAGARVSSSRIRALIAAGKLSQARGLLGRPSALYGRVVRGSGRGHRLGFPTANLRLTTQVLPPQGVYAVAVETRPADRRWFGVLNLGVRPTFGTGPLVCEVHLFNFSGSLRGVDVSASLLCRLRSERCFPSAVALKQQVQRDIHRARQLFRRHCSR